jgi:hypothetical protein
MAPDIDRLAGYDQEPIAERMALIKRTAGQKVLIPDIISLLPGWRCELQPDIDSVNVEIDEWLKTYVASAFN